MTRSRSGSFYCPVEPSLGPLSITQKAAISAPVRPLPTPLCTPSTRQRSSLGGRSVEHRPLEVATLEKAARHHPALPSLRNVVPFQGRAGFAMTPCTSASGAGVGACGFPGVQRHAHSPSRPSPLRRQVHKPLCPSALWTSQKEVLPLYYPSMSGMCSSSRSKGGLYKGVLKNTFLAGPMAQKAKLYGLRVAWCVFGDAKEEMARDIFGPVPEPTPSPVEPPEEGLDHVFVEHEETVDSDESSESEYSDEDGDTTASEESDDLELDDEEEMEAELFQFFRDTEGLSILDKEPLVTEVVGEEMWEVISLQVS